MNDDQKCEDLKSWLGVLEGAVTDLRIDQHIFWEVQEIIRANPGIQKPGDFNRWMARMYSAAISVAIRRQVDEDCRSISFVRFLGEVKRTPAVVSRDRYVAFFKASGSPEYLANADFDRHVGVGRDVLDPAVVEKEIETLKLKTDPLRAYVNKRVAHYYEKEFTSFPKFQDIDEAIDYLEVLLKRYVLLFRASGLARVLPYWQYEWREVFYQPWIDRKEEQVNQDLRYPIGKFQLEDNLSEARRKEMIEQVAETPAKVRAAVAGFDEKKFDTPYREGGWTVRQLVHHLADSHMNAYVRFKLALTEDEPTIKTYEQERWAETVDSRTAPAEISLTMLDGLHHRWAMLLCAMSAADYARKFNHPELGKMTLDQLLSLYAWHGRHHTAHITALRERMEWE